MNHGSTKPYYQRKLTNCRNCGKFGYCHGRGLCWVCGKNPAVRDRFPSQRRVAPYTHRCNNLAKPLPPEPTRARPGTAEKLRVMEEREAAGYAVFHPGDYVEGD